MFSPKSFYPSNFLVLDLYRGIRLTHESVAQQIDTVSNMRRRGHHRYLFFYQCPTFSSRLIRNPMPLPYSVLNVISACLSRRQILRCYYKAMELMEDRESRSLWRNGRMLEESALFGEKFLPSSISLIRGGFPKGSVVPKNLRDSIYYIS